MMRKLLLNNFMPPHGINGRQRFAPQIQAFAIEDNPKGSRRPLFQRLGHGVVKNGTIRRKNPRLIFFFSKMLEKKRRARANQKREVCIHPLLAHHRAETLI
jgi:hypothetical protein